LSTTSSQDCIQNNFSFFHAVDKDLYDCSIHIHDGYEIYYFVSGDVTYYIEGTSYKLHPNDLLLINPTELHRPLLGSKCIYERKVMNFSKDFLQELNFKDYNLFRCLDERPSGKNNLIPSYEVLANNINLLIESIEKCTTNNPSQNILRKTYVTQLLITLNNIIDSNKNDLIILNKSNERIASIIQYINDNLDSNLSLGILEDKFYVTKFYLCHKFKEITGFTLNEYITYKRIMKSRELIKLSYPLTEIHKLVGFSDYSNFYKAFKKANGISPREYKSVVLK
jgi:YesN/AraC family two-component response regulator